jgi:hypothetical protein
MTIHATDARAALQWVHGDINDETLKAATGNTAIFIEWLLNPGEVRDMLAECVKLADAGAVTLVCRTKNPTIEHKLQKIGGVRVSQDNPPFDPQGRWIVVPDGFKAWIQKLRCE